MDTAAVVISLARIGAGSGDRPLPMLGAPIDWQAVLDLSGPHRVAPLVRQALSAAPPDMVPATILAEFKARMWRGIAAGLLCESVLGALLDMVASQGIEVLVLKGAALAHDLYPRPELRPYGDLDILCRPADFPRLTGALIEAGYQREDPNDAAGLQPPLDSSRRRNFIDPSGDVLIEVHLDVLGLGLPARHRGDFWREARTIETRRLRMRTLCPTHQLLHLAVHVHAHCYSRLLWLIDLDLLIRRHGEAIDWGRLPALARDEGVGVVLRHVLATVHAILGTPIPALPPPTAGERLMAICYRRIWPLENIQRLERSEHLRLLRFHPGTGDPRDVYYSLLLLGRRREKWRAWRRHSRTSG
jgi:hypothetical protein